MKKVNILLIPLIALFLLTSAAKNPVELVTKGKVAYFAEDYEKAIYYFKEALSVNKNYLDALVQIAHVYYDMENYDYAYMYVGQAIKLSGKNKELEIFSADIETKLRHFDIAEKKYKGIISEDPLNYEAYNGLANLYLETGRKIMARNTLNDILKSQPGNFKALLLIAAYYENIDRARADSYHRKNIQHNSLNPEAYFAYSLFNFNNGEITRALDAVKTAISIKEKTLYIIYYGKYLLYQNRADEALENFKKVIKRASPNYLHYYHLAHSYYLLSDYSSAIMLLDKAIRLRNDDEIASSFLDLILVNKISIDDNRRISRSNFYFSQAKKYKKESLFDLYMFSLKQAIRIYPKNVEARLELAEYYKISKYPERYIRELAVIAKYTDDIKIKDKLEIEPRKISYKLGDDWDVSQYTVELDTFSIPLFFDTNIKNHHFNFEKIYARMIQTLSYNKMRYEIVVFDEQDYEDFEKMNIAREKKSPFFLNLTANEESNAIDAKLELVNASNNELMMEYKTFQKGNNRIVSTAHGLLRKLDKDIPFKARILRLKSDKALINAGKRSGIKLKDKLLILKPGDYSIEIDRSNLVYKPEDVKGTAFVVKVDENIAEVKFKDKSFFKDVDIDDIIILEK